MTNPTTGEILIVTGLSGSGKSTFLNALEDGGFFCIDRLPVELLPKVIELSAPHNQQQRFAFGLDIRAAQRPHDTLEIINRLKQQGHRVKLIFLQANDDTLITRYSTTRRPHPLPKDSLIESITYERNTLDPLRSIANEVIDTSHFNVHTLKEYALQQIQEHDRSKMKITIMSFGFKHGLPTPCDILFDVRFLKNPYFIDQLRDKRGTHPLVQQFVLQQPESERILQLFRLIKTFLPNFENEGKSYLTLAVGCTGGHHRSVAIAQAIADEWKGEFDNVVVRHRDIEK